MGNDKFYDRYPLNVNSNGDGVHVNQNWNPENVNDNLGAAVEAVSKLNRKHLYRCFLFLLCHQVSYDIIYLIINTTVLWLRKSKNQQGRSRD